MLVAGRQPTRRAVTGVIRLKAAPSSDGSAPKAARDERGMPEAADARRLSRWRPVEESKRESDESPTICATLLAFSTTHRDASTPRGLKAEGHSAEDGLSGAYLVTEHECQARLVDLQTVHSLASDRRGSFWSRRITPVLTRS